MIEGVYRPDEPRSLKMMHRQKCEEPCNKLGSTLQPAIAQKGITVSPHESMIPPRTLFPNLEPMGLRTADVEKLTSYLTRLAAQSHITLGSLVEKYFESGRELKYPQIGSGYHPAKQRINAQGATAYAWVIRANQLVDRGDLSLLTLLPWSNAFSERSQLTSAARRWCPLCLAQDHTAGTPVYERLIWSLQYVELCPRHHCYLEDQCPTCRRRCMPEFNRRQLCGFCSSCGAWLGSTTPTCLQPFDEAVLSYQAWAAECFADLLANPPRSTSAEHRERIVRVIDTCTERLFLGDRTASSQHHGALRSDTTEWLRGRRYPNPRMLLNISYGLQISLRDLFAGNIARCSNASLPPLPFTTPPPPRLPPPPTTDWAKVEHVLREVASGTRPFTSLACAAKSFGMRPALVSARFPSLCTEVGDAARALRAKIDDERRRQRDTLLAEYISTKTRQMLDAGEYPSVRKLSLLARAQGLASSKDAYRIREIQLAALQSAPRPNHHFKQARG
ncbi:MULTISPECIES: TniQ family protein [Burkholderia]|uniref:TniQ family protein n=1 Tax=Burkholderia TaxID=32008 RepID=UPI00158DE31C|nr:TniQ family protein [Burkholderia ambifaria]